MSRNILRQLVDIQIQADNLHRKEISWVEVENFKNYSDELKAYLKANIELAEVQQLLKEIPDIEWELRRGNPNFWWNLIRWVLPDSEVNREAEAVEEARQTAAIIKGKYASIAFLLKNY